jgi:hypothetical protein
VITYNPGDVVHHIPSKEDWLVAAPSPDGTEIVCCGWPESIAKSSDCTLVRSASEEAAIDLARRVVKSCPDQLRGSWAREWLRVKGVSSS